MAIVSKEERRRDILENALAVFSERGYHAAKIEDIVSRAGVAKGTFYLYFSDKRATFEELVDTFVARLKEAIQRIDPKAPARPQLKANVLKALDLIMSERALARILLSHAFGVDPEIDRKLIDFYDAIAHMIERALLLGQGMEVVRSCDCRLASYAILGMAKEIAWRIVVRGYEVDLHTLASQLLEQSLAGLLLQRSPSLAAV